MHGNCICHELSCSLSVFVDIILESFIGNVHLAKTCKDLVSASVVVGCYVCLKLGYKRAE